MRVIGIDPGSRRTGWAVVERATPGFRVVASGVIVTDVADTMPRRLAAIHEGLRATLLLHQPDAAALEEIFAHKSVASALVLGQARGVAMLAVASLPLSTYNANTIKKTVTGNGRAEKAQVTTMVAHHCRVEAPRLADEADAIAIAITHLIFAGVATADRPPNPHAAVLEAAFGSRRKRGRDQWTEIARKALAPSGGK